MVFWFSMYSVRLYYEFNGGLCVQRKRFDALGVWIGPQEYHEKKELVIFSEKVVYGKRVE